MLCDLCVIGQFDLTCLLYTLPRFFSVHLLVCVGLKLCETHSSPCRNDSVSALWDCVAVHCRKGFFNLKFEVGWC